MPGSKRLLPDSEMNSKSDKTDSHWLPNAATFAKMKALALQPQAYLDNNDATAFFEATGDLLQPGPTLTNVNDIRVILVD